VANTLKLSQKYKPTSALPRRQHASTGEIVGVF
jgi:hypothetical protein